MPASFPPARKPRVALAKSLINKPELLLLDEPTASLDPDTGDLVRSWLERYRTESGCTILLASHNMDEVARLCDTVLMMKQGRIVDRGTPCRVAVALRAATIWRTSSSTSPATASAMPWVRHEGLAPTGLGGSSTGIWALYRRSWPRLLDLAYWPVLQMLIWGFTSSFFAARLGNGGVVAMGMLLGGVLLWETALRSHLGFAVTFMEEIWSRNLGHIFVSPLRPWELLAALVVMSVVRMALGVIPAALVAALLYHYNVLTIGPILILFAANLIVMGWWIALGCVSLILSQGGWRGKPGVVDVVRAIAAGGGVLPGLGAALVAAENRIAVAGSTCVRGYACRGFATRHPLGPFGLGGRFKPALG